MRSLAILAVLAVSGTALAQAPGQVSQITPAAEPSAPAARDPATAVGMSLAFTLGGAAALTLGASLKSEGLSWIGVAGLYVGPSTGHWYAGRIDGLGLGLRAGAAAAMVYGLTQVLAADDWDCIDLDQAQCDQAAAHAHQQQDTGGAFMIGGLAVWIGSTIYDIATTRGAVEDWNREHSVQLAPVVLSAGGRRVPGLVLGGTF